MGLNHSPRINTDGLIFYADPSNIRCYQGSGNSFNNLTFINEREEGYGYSNSGDGFAYVSKQTAADLNFTFGTSKAKGESDQISGVCSGLMTFDQALAWAHDAGARLPTISEVYNSVAQGSGCGYDAELVWTADSVPGTNGTSHYCVYGNMAGYGYDIVSKSNSSTAYVRYVADVDLNRSDPEILIENSYLKSWLENYYSETISVIPNSQKSIEITSNSFSDPVLVNGAYIDSGHFVFDGANDYITLNKTCVGSGEILLGNSAYTLEAWVWIDQECNPGTLTAGCGIIGTDSANGVGLQIVAGPKVNFGMRSTNNFEGSTVLDKSKWYHIVGVRDPAVANIIYVNGEPDATLTKNDLTVLAPGAAQMKIGYISGRLTTPFKGKISGIKIYNVALSAEMVKQNFNTTRSKFGI